VQRSRWECTVEGPDTIRVGLRYVKGLREAAAQTLLAARAEKPFESMDDFLRRTNFIATDRRALAAVGAFHALTPHRRAALWQIEAAWSDNEALFKQFAEAYADDAPLTAMSNVEETQADFFGLGLTTGEHPMARVRERIPDVCPAEKLRDIPHGRRVTIAGSVICRQRPGTAAGFVFISLEDETGIANAVVVPDLFERLRLVITQESALRITGRLQNVSNVTHVKAEKIEPFRESELPAQASHDFH
jgi:error-prone DNA polymerase